MLFAILKALQDKVFYFVQSAICGYVCTVMQTALLSLVKAVSHSVCSVPRPVTYRLEDYKAGHSQSLYR